MGGISFIAIHPDCVELEEYISFEELSALEKYLSEDNTNEFGLFTGNYAINPLTGDKIPVFVSTNYNEQIHIGNTYTNLEDYRLANSEGIRTVDIVQDGIMINSDFFIFISIFTLIFYLRFVSPEELHSTALCKDNKIIKPSDESLRRTAAVRSMFMSNKSMSRLWVFAQTVP